MPPSSPAEPLVRLDRLLESSLAPQLAGIPGATNIVAAALTRNSRICRKRFAALGGDAGAVARSLREALERMEESFAREGTWGDLTNLEAVTRAAQTCYERRPRFRHPDSCYLTERAAMRLLGALSPHMLMKALEATTVEELAEPYGALGALALTRYTEPDDWQDVYLAALDATPSDDFENRAVGYIVADRTRLSAAVGAAGRSIKSWSMGHSKETGLVICFTHDPAARPRLPHLLFAALFYHYFFETTRAGESTGLYMGRQPGPRGAHIAAIIRSTRRTFSFLHPNIHSEALYWESALRHLAAQFPALGLGAYVPLLGHGDFVSANDRVPTSLNIIDHLWAAALTGAADSYRYHFQEAFWSDVLRRLRRLSRTESAYAALHTLDLDDVAFTNEMFAKAAPARSFVSRVRPTLSAVLKMFRRLLGLQNI